MNKDNRPIKLIVDRSRAIIGLSHYLAIYLWFGWLSFIPFIIFTYSFFYNNFRAPFLIVIVLFTISAFTSIEEEEQPMWGYAIGRWITKKAEEYFSLRIYSEDHEAINSKSPAIIALEPHDILPVGIFAFSEHLGYFPVHRFRCCVSSAIFIVPGMRHIYTWMHATDVSKERLRQLLTNGYSPGICPGGANEVTYMVSSSPEDPNKKECVLYLKNRLGMIRMAAQFGIPIIPVFVFNQRNCFRYWVPQIPWIHRLGRKIGFIPLLFTGLFYIPFGPPLPCALNVVTGLPISVPKLSKDCQSVSSGESNISCGTDCTITKNKHIENTATINTKLSGSTCTSNSDSKEEAIASVDCSATNNTGKLSDDQLRPYLEQYIQAMQRIFENNKAQFGMGDVTLRIE